MGTYFRLNTARFKRAMDEAFFARPRQDVEKFVMTQARGFVRWAVAITPPGHDARSGLVTGTAAKKRGEATIAADVARVVAPARVLKSTGKRQRADKGLNIRALVEAKRNPRTGRVSTGQRRPLHVGPATEVKAEIKRRQRGVGWLASGWKAAARKVGFRLPEWIERHDAPSRVDLRLDRSKLRLRMVNLVPWASQVRGLERRVQWALNQQAKTLARGTHEFLKRQARRHGFRVR